MCVPFILQVYKMAEKKELSHPIFALSSTYSQQTAWSGWRFIDCMRKAFSGDSCMALKSKTPKKGVTCYDLFRCVSSLSF